MPPQAPRRAAPGRRIAREAWATDILRERSYVWLLVSRLLFLTAGSLLVNFVVIYLGARVRDVQGARRTGCTS